MTEAEAISATIGSPRNVDALRLRRGMGRDNWLPPEPFGPDGWSMTTRNHQGSVIVTCAEHDGVEWVHASIARTAYLPTYAELTRLHTAVWGETGWAYQVFTPPAAHVNIHEHALHLWGRLDGRRVLPDFGSEGTI
jgi:hypothetical protein